jgi:putative endonuclease
VGTLEAMIRRRRAPPQTGLAGVEPSRRGGDARKRLGSRGEDAAVEHLVRRGLVILVRNYRTRLGEIDVVAADGETIAFVEVKLRRGGFDPLEAVDLRKQQQIARVAFDFLRRHAMLGRPARFDVVAVDGRTFECTHVADAFDCTIDD